MILTLATSAQAALSLSLSATTVAVDNTVTLSIYSDSSDWWTGNLILSEDIENWTDPVAAMYGNIITYPPPPGGVSHPSPAVYRIMSGGQAGVQFAVEVIKVQFGAIYISLQDDTTYAEMSSNGPLTFVEIPEPASATLIALGALLLYRRHRPG
jgi:hypothetical protein